MNNIKSLINGRLVINVKNYRDFFQSINLVITENKMLFDKLPLSVQNSLGTDLYGLKQLNVDQYDNILAKSLFQPDQFNKHVNYLISILKYLLTTHVSLLFHNKNIQPDEKYQLETKINTMNIAVNSTTPITPAPEPAPAPALQPQSAPQAPLPLQQPLQPQSAPQAPLPLQQPLLAQAPQAQRSKAYTKFITNMNDIIEVLLLFKPTYKKNSQKNSYVTRFIIMQ